MLADAKKALCEVCNDDLLFLELPFIPRRSFEKRSQAMVDLEDILHAFGRFDTVEIPDVFCEATELVKLPLITVDPISIKFYCRVMVHN